VYYAARTVGLFDVHCGNVGLFYVVGLFCLCHAALTVGLFDIHCGNVGLFYVVGLFCAYCAAFSLCVYCSAFNIGLFGHVGLFCVYCRAEYMMRLFMWCSLAYIAETWGSLCIL